VQSNLNTVCNYLIDDELRLFNQLQNEYVVPDILLAAIPGILDFDILLLNLLLIHCCAITSELFPTFILSQSEEQNLLEKLGSGKACP
jgi:hypothetical protein